MTFPDFDPIGPLDSQGRRNFIRHNISDDTWMNYSATSILSSLRNIGYGIRNADFLNIRNEIIGAIRDRDFILGLDDDGLIPISSMTEKPGVRLSQLVQYRMKLTIIDPDTGEIDDVYRSLSSNQHYTKHELIALAENVFDTTLYPDLGDIISIDLNEVWRQPGAIPFR